MKTRDKALIEMREAQLGETSHLTSQEEEFQNKTLRPILKLQNDLFLDSFKNYVNKHKGEFYNLSIEKQELFIENALHRDIKYRNTITGMVLGVFTLKEFSEYVQNSSSLNKRMLNMVIERLKDQIQLIGTERTDITL